MLFFENTAQFFSRFSRWNLLFFGVAAGAVPVSAFVINLPIFHQALPRLGAFGLAVGLGAIFLRAYFLSLRASISLGWGTSLAGSLLGSASLYLVLSYIPEISTYPFTLTWSEASRYYYASLYFSERIYGIQTPPTVLHPSRYLMQAIPFLLPESPIWLHRAWQVLLWIIMPTIASLLFARRLNFQPGLQRWLFVAAAYLVWMVGPVYYHLLVPVIIVIWGFQARSIRSPRSRFAISALAVFTASAWAGVSRVNWYPVPGLMASALILMEEPIVSGALRQKFSYILRLAGWTIFGAATAFLAQVGYIFWSGNSVEQFTTSFSSSLLWHRLLPNATYPPGLLLAILIVSLPMVGVIWARIFDHPAGKAAWRRFHPLRLLGLAGILLIFFLGGMVVSVKIGGGSNLHNLDAYLTFLLIISAYFYYRQVAEEPDFQFSTAETLADQPSSTARLSPQLILHLALTFGLIIYSASVLLTHVPASSSPDPGSIQENLNELADPVYRAVQEGGEVLFLSNRQLLTFENLQVPLVPEYERVFLMEAAMANDPDYLGRLYQELADHRYALIVSEPLSRELKDPRSDFGAENNAWVENLSRHILCNYTPIKTLREVQLQILAPAQKPKKNCP